MSASSTSDHQLAYAILGPLHVTSGDASVPLGGRQQRAVLARLLVAGATGASVEQLADMLWRGHPPSEFATTIQTYVFHLRKLLEPERARGAPGQVLVTDHGRYRLSIPPDAIDVAQFERATEAGERLLSAGEEEAAVAELRRGLALWRGDVLEDLADYDFVVPVAARLNEQRLTAIEAEIDCRLSLGRPASVITELDELIAQHPLREQLHQRRMLALYRSGRQSDALNSYEQLRRQLRDELGVDPSAPLRQLYQQVLTHDPALDWHPQLAGDGKTVYTYNRLTWTDGVVPSPLAAVSGAIDSPYRGLSAFDERDAAFFFGREAATAAVLERMSRRLGDCGLLVVSGVSGAGKSSLLRAGVLPQVRRKGLATAPDSAGWPCLLITPARAPLDELAVAVATLAGLDAAAVRRGLDADPTGFALTARQAAAARAGGAADSDAAAAAHGQPRLLLVIDQFEQVFTQCPDERQRQAFFTALHAAATGTHGEPPAALVVLGVRADFEARCADYPQLAGAVQDRYLVTAMTDRQLRMAITEPAKAAGSRVEDDLVEALLREITTRRTASPAVPGPTSGAGALPLLSHALDQAWRNRAGEVLTVADYERTGGIEGAVAGSAQRAYDGLTTAQQGAARHVFIRLTATSSEGIDTAARATRAELIDGKSGEEARDVDAVLEAFVAERLLILAAGTVEISHEVLLTAWPLLRDTWLAETHADRIIRTRLHNVAVEWTRHSRDPSYLYSGSLLESARDTAARADADPVRHPPLSTGERDFLAASDRARRRRVLLRRTVTATLLVLVIAFASTAVWALHASQNAAQQRNVAVSRQLINESMTLANADPTIARLESLAAWRIHPSNEARYAMLSAAVLPGIAALTGQAGYVSSVAFSPDGKTLATGIDDGTVRLWSVAARQQLGNPLAGNAGSVNSVAFSPDGKSLATGTSYGTVLFWNAATHERIRSPLIDLPNPVNSVAFSPDGKTVATGNDDRSVRVWDVANGKPNGNNFDGHTKRVNSVAFSPDGNTLASGSADNTVRLWNVATQQQIGKALTGHTDDVSSVAFSSDGTIVASGSADRSVRLWRVATHQQIGHPLTAHASGVFSTAFSPRTNVLASGSGDGTVRLWDVQTGQQIGDRVVGHADSVASVAFSPDGTTLASGSAYGTVRLWAGPTYQRVGNPLTGHTGDVSSVAFSANGRILASSSVDTTVRFWDVPNHKANGRPVAVHYVTGNADYASINAVAFSPDGKVLASGVSDGTLRVWNVAKRKMIVNLFPGASSLINSVAFNPDGKTVATGTSHSEVWLWDVTNHRSDSLAGHIGSVNSVAFSSNGKMLASGSSDSTVRLWNVATRQPIGRLFAGHTAGINSVAFSPDGRVLASGSDDGTVLLWDVATRQQIGSPLVGHTASVNSVAFSPDGKTLASGSDDRAILLWDVTTRQLIGGPLAGHTGSVTSVAFSPDGKILASGSFDHTVRLWNVAYLADPIPYLCAATGRSFTRTEWRTYVPPGPPYRKLCP